MEPPTVFRVSVTSSSAPVAAGWARSLWALGESEGRKSSESTLQFNLALGSAAKTGRWRWAMALLQAMRAIRVQSSEVTCGTA
ncbi:unnamed protein product, partial [Polarella glacialis]